MPALRLVAVGVDAPLDQVNEVGNGMVVVTVADPVESPWHLTFEISLILAENSPFLMIELTAVYWHPVESVITTEISPECVNEVVSVVAPLDHK